MLTPCACAAWSSDRRQRDHENTVALTIPHFRTDSKKAAVYEMYITSVYYIDKKMSAVYLLLSMLLSMLLFFYGLDPVLHKGAETPFKHWDHLKAFCFESEPRAVAGMGTHCSLTSWCEARHLDTMHWPPLHDTPPGATPWMVVQLV